MSVSNDMCEDIPWKTKGKRREKDEGIKNWMMAVDTKKKLAKFKIHDMDGEKI